MAYPGLSLEEAEKIDQARRTRGVLPAVADVQAWKPGPDFETATASDCLEQCCDVLYAAQEDGASMAEFDGRCAPILHHVLQLRPRIAGDGDFWRWLTFTQGGFGAQLVDWRYRPRGRGSGDPDGLARPVYYGLRRMKKGMFAKLWMCAEAMHIPGAHQPYDGIEYADADLWDSHIIDIDYGSVPAMARAFVKFVRDRQLPRGEATDPTASAGFRDLAKEVRRRHATIALELLDDSAAYTWLHAVWSDRQEWCGKR